MLGNEYKLLIELILVKKKTNRLKMLTIKKKLMDREICIKSWMKNVNGWVWVDGIKNEE